MTSTVQTGSTVDHFLERVITIIHRENKGRFKDRAVPGRPGEMSTILDEEFQPRQTHEIMEYQVGEELSLYDPRTEVVHILNPTAAAVWKMCDGSKSVRDISVRVTEAYDLTLAVVHPDVQEVIFKFLESGLIS